MHIQWGKVKNAIQINFLVKLTTDNFRAQCFSHATIILCLPLPLIYFIPLFSQKGLSEEEVRAAASCAGEEVMIRNRFSEMNAPKESSSVNK